MIKLITSVLKKVSIPINLGFVKVGKSTENEPDMCQKIFIRKDTKSNWDKNTVY